MAEPRARRRRVIVRDGQGPKWEILRCLSQSRPFVWAEFERLWQQLPREDGPWVELENLLDTCRTHYKSIVDLYLRTFRPSVHFWIQLTRCWDTDTLIDYLRRFEPPLEALVYDANARVLEYILPRLPAGTTLDARVLYRLTPRTVLRLMPVLSLSPEAKDRQARRADFEAILLFIEQGCDAPRAFRIADAMRRVAATWNVACLPPYEGPRTPPPLVMLARRFILRYNVDTDLPWALVDWVETPMSLQTFAEWSVR